MFGFINTNVDALSPEEEARYKEAYCGLCHALGSRTGQHTRMALSHDLTFLALLHMSLYDPEETKHQTACVMHPLTKRTWTQNEYLDYAADMTVALAYFKLLDNWSDDHSHPSRLAALTLKKRWLEISDRWPRQAQAIEAGMAAISQIEQDDHGNPDAAANAFGLIMGEIFVHQEDFWENPLRMMGRQLGRFIYLMDAAVDLEEDRQKGSYNPFAHADFTQDQIHDLLTVYMGYVTEVFEKLPLVEDVNLLRNVLYSGVWQRWNSLHESKEND
ncbi:MAG: DUF5685 family protein [Coriobacteriia bacterium]|nr:DUF5685 family protein [Coriobacteriia bacterium]